MIIDFMKKRKLFSTLLFVFICSFILGVFFIFFISDDNKVLVKEGIELYFNGLSNLNYTDNFIVGLINNIGLGLIIWLLGISIFGCFIIFIIYFIKCFVVNNRRSIFKTGIFNNMKLIGAVVASALLVFVILLI